MLSDAVATAVSIGRAPEVAIRLDWDGQVSGLHAVLERVGPAWTIVDDGLSTNGTHVNHEVVTGRRRLRDGDLIQVGETEISYLEPPDARGRSVTVAVPVPPFEADLSKTQKRVLVALCRPLHDQGAYASPATNQEVADAVFLSLTAVKSHLRALFAKFELADLPQNRKRAALAEAALRSGAISPRDFGI
jgi:DNA-binding CsgD family transcriptional regulator